MPLGVAITPDGTRAYVTIAFCGAGFVASPRRPADFHKQKRRPKSHLSLRDFGQAGASAVLGTLPKRFTEQLSAAPKEPESCHPC